MLRTWLFRFQAGVFIALFGKLKLLQRSAEIMARMYRMVMVIGIGNIGLRFLVFGLPLFRIKLK